MNGPINGVRKSKILPKLINSFLIILLVFLFTKISLLQRIFFQNTTLLDFDSYYLLANNIRHGINPYSSWLTFSLGPPLVFLYFFPFSYLNPDLARHLATVVNIFSGFVICFLLAKEFNKKYLLTTFLVLTIIFFSSFLPRFSLGMGQPLILITLLVTLIITGKNNFYKGVFLAVITSVKTFFVFPILSFVRNKKVILAFCLAIVLFILISLLFIKTDWYIYYFNNIFFKLNNSPLTSSGLDYYNQSLKSTFFRLGIIGAYKFLFFPIVIAISLLTALTGSFELSIIAAVFLSPVSWQFYSVVLFPIFVVVFFKMKKNPRNLSLFTISFVLWFVEFPWLHNADMNLINGILASHYFISGLILSFLLPKRK